MSEPASDGDSRSHALLVSSDPQFVDRAMDLLHPHMRVALVSSSDNHLEAVAQSAHPDLFIIDIDDMDWQVTGRLTTIEQIRTLFPEVPIAFASSDISTATLIPAMRAGANDVLDKNASADEILAITDQMTSRRSTRATSGDGRVVTTLGLRAGVGTTTLSLALAEAILELDRNLGPVLYLDFSAAPSEASDLLGVSPNYAMLDAVNDLGRLDSSIIEGAFARSESGLYVLPLAAEPIDPNPPEAIEIPNLIFVLKSHFRFIFVDPNAYALPRTVIDRLFCDADVPILCTDQSVTSIHACSDFFHSIEPVLTNGPPVLLAITRYDPRISPKAVNIVQTFGTDPDYQVIPWDRQHVEHHRNAGLPLVHTRARSPFTESVRRMSLKIDDDIAAARANTRKGRPKWPDLLRLTR